MASLLASLLHAPQNSLAVEPGQKDGRNFSPKPVNLSRDESSYGPQMVALDGNTVYVLWTTFSSANNKTGIFLRKSSDGGSTFESRATVSEKVGSNPKLAVSGDNNVYVTWEGDDTDHRSRIYFARSTDGGRTFEKPVVLSKDIKYSDATLSYDPQMVTTEKGVYVAWSVSNYSWGAIFVAASQDGGSTFKVAKVSTNSSGTARMAKLAAPGNDVLYIAWSIGGYESGNYSADIQFARSTDGGKSFQPAKNLRGTKPFEAWPQLVADGRNVYVTWIDADAPGHPNLVLAKSTDGGGTFSKSALTPRGSGPAVGGTWQASPVNGKVTWAWQQFYNGYGVFVMNDKGTVKKISGDLYRDTSPYETALTPSIASRGDMVYIAWRDALSNYETFVAASTDGGSTFSSPVNLSNTAGDTVDAPQVAIAAGGGGGGAYVAWTDEIQGSRDVFFAKILPDTFADSSNPAAKPSEPPAAATPPIATVAEEQVFEIWATDSEISQAWWTSIEGRIHPRPQPDAGREIKYDEEGNVTDPGSGVVFSTDVTRPDGSRYAAPSFNDAAGYGNNGVYSLYYMYPDITRNMTGPWTLQATAKWIANGTAHEIKSNAIRVIVREPVFAGNGISEIGNEKLVRLSHSGSNPPVFQILDWKPDRDKQKEEEDSSASSVLISYQDFSASPRRGWDLALMSWDGKEITRLNFPTSHYIFQARFSPDGGKILAGGMLEDENKVELIVYDLRSETTIPLPGAGASSRYDHFGYADWTPDGRVVYVNQEVDRLAHESKGPVIWVMDMDGGKKDVIYQGQDKLYAADVSPDGKKIAFLRNLYPASPGMDMVVFDVEKKEFTSLASGESLGSPRWSPGSDLVFYQTFNTNKVPGGSLRLASSDGTLKENLYEVFIGAPSSFAISPDGSSVLMSLDAGKLATLTLAQAVPEFEVGLFVAAVALGVLVALGRLLAKNRAAL